MIVGFGIPALVLFVRGQRGKKPLYFPYREVLTALLLAAVIAASAELLPEFNHWLELAIAFGSARALDRAPGRRCARSRRQHWKPLLHMIRSFRRGTPADFRPRKGLRSLEPGDPRRAARCAVVGRLPRERLAPGGRRARA